MTPALTQHDWLNIFSNGLNAGNFTVIASVALLVARRKDVGHRVLLLLLAAFSIAMVMVNLSAAWDSANRVSTLHTALFRAACALVGSVCVVYFLANLSDVIVTFKRSETIDRLEHDAVDDRTQSNMNMEFLSSQMSNESEALLVRRQAGIRAGRDGKDDRAKRGSDIRPSRVIGSHGSNHARGFTG